MAQPEYPFWAKWAKRVGAAIVPITDITSVTYQIKIYNETTNVFDNVSGANGTILSSDADGRWIAPFVVPEENGFFKYECVFTPVGGSHQVLIDQLESSDGDVGGGDGGIGDGTETHSNKVCDPDGTPLEGVLVKATPYGTTYNFASTTTDALGEYTLTGLHANHAYQIYYNKDGYWGKQSELVIA